VLLARSVVKFWPEGHSLLHFTPGPQRWNLFPGGNFHPFVHPQEWTNTHSLRFRRIEGRTDNFTPRG
jgi:hypothetical protein